MTDRELLEAAAKAAGIALEKPSPWFGYSDGRGFERLNMDGSAVEWRWSPLTDDGDALRLAVKLRLEVNHNPDRVLAWARGEMSVVEMHGNDPYAATRRAITRAAAALAPQGVPEHG